MDYVDIGTSGADLDTSGDMSADDTQSNSGVAETASSTPTAVMCGRCKTFTCMFPHDLSCDKPLIKFICCVKCQHLSTTTESYLAHVKECIGLTANRAPVYTAHIVKFDVTPELGVCESCGVYRQREGVLLDAHRHICALYVRENENNRFPFLPSERAWLAAPDVYVPPRYFARMISDLATGKKWKELEAKHLAQSGMADCWAQLPCGAVRGPDDRRPFHAGAIMRLRAAGAPAEADRESVTSGNTTSTLNTSDTTHASSADEQTLVKAVQQVAHRQETPTNSPTSINVRIGGEASLVAHIAPQRQAQLAQDARSRRGQRGGRGARARRQRRSDANQAGAGPAQSGVSSSGVAVASAGGSTHNTTARRQSHPLVPRESTPRPLPPQRQRADNNQGDGARQHRRRPMRNGGGGPGAARAVHQAGDGIIRVTSPLEDSGMETERGDRDALWVSPSRHGPAADARRRRQQHLYLEGAVHDCRSGLFVSSMFICGIPPTGVMTVLTRDGAELNVRLSYYPIAHGIDHLDQRTRDNIRAQALVFNSSTKEPMGIVLFWDRPPVSVEWFLPIRDDARGNPGARSIRTRFAALRRG